MIAERHALWAREDAATDLLTISGSGGGGGGGGGNCGGGGGGHEVVSATMRVAEAGGAGSDSQFIWQAADCVVLTRESTSVLLRSNY